MADSVDLLGADRIEHGVRSFEVPGLVERLAEPGIVPRRLPDLEHHAVGVPELRRAPLPALLDAGVRCSLNADDPLLFGPGLLEEYELGRREFGFDDERMAAIALRVRSSAAAPPTPSRRRVSPASRPGSRPRRPTSPVERRGAGDRSRPAPPARPRA